METISKPKKTIKADRVNISVDDYRLNVDLKTPSSFNVVARKPSNMLRAGFHGQDDGPPRQQEIYRENPEFPLGIPVRSDGHDIDLIIDYRVSYHPAGQPENVSTDVFRYIIPVHFQEEGTDEINLSETLPLG